MARLSLWRKAGWRKAGLIAVLVGASFVGVAQAANLKVLSAGALRSALQELAPEFENASGNHLLMEFATAGRVEQRVESDEAIDVAILTEPRLKKLVGEGKIAKDSIALIGRALIGLAVKKGAPRPDIGSVDAFKRTLLAAKSIGYTDPASGGTSGIHMAKIFEQLGIADELKPKLRPIAGTAGAPPSVGGAVALGVAEMGLQPISEMRDIPGIDIVGPIPAELQSPDLVYFAGVTAASTQPEAAKALIDFLGGFEAAPVIKSKGLDPR
jgi:molybdate transport system substrate-binding protein